MPHRRTTPTRVLAAAAFVALAAGALSGCSVVDEPSTSRGPRASRAWPTPRVLARPRRMGAEDATDIRIVESTASADPTAVILLTSSTALDPAECAEIDRMSGAQYTIEEPPTRTRRRPPTRAAWDRHRVRGRLVRLDAERPRRGGTVTVRAVSGRAYSPDW